MKTDLLTKALPSVERSNIIRIIKEDCRKKE
jgi:hypothetical protein